MKEEDEEGSEFITKLLLARFVICKKKLPMDGYTDRPFDQRTGPPIDLGLRKILPNKQ